jgi:hypothetical protein
VGSSIGYSASRSLLVACFRFSALLLILGLLGVIEGCSSGSSGTGSGGGNSTTPAPAVASINPSQVPAGSSALTLTVTGSGFLNTSVVQVGSAQEATTYVSPTQLTATVPATQLVSGAEIPVVVLNGALNSGSGPAINLEVDNPAPTISSASPSGAPAGTASAVVTVTGTGFVPTTVINVNGSARATTFINATQVSAALSTADFAVAGSLSVTAVNAAPGGGTSAAISFPVNNPSVGVIQLSPSSIIAGGSAAATITVTGNTFVSTSVVQVNGTARATTYVNATTLTFAATVADQATVGKLFVNVMNPAPGGGTSPAANLSIVPRPATPVITSVTPTTLIAGSAASSLAVAGTGFTTGSVVQWNGANLQTTPITYYNGTVQLVATVPASDLTAVGTASITVITPNATPPVSNTVTMNITNPPVPTLTAISPNGGPINTASKVNLTGTGFTANTTVAVNGQTIPSTFVSSTQLTATLSASILALPGNVNVTVTTPAPGGGTSSPQVYTTYISMPNNDLVYNSADGLLYASVPVSAAGVPGNSVVGIDPFTGTVTRQIQVGSNPNRLALSTDGTQLFVGLDGAGAVAQVNLGQGKVVNQFSLGGGQGVYNPPFTAQYLAAVPGSPNSVAVAVSGGIFSGAGVTIYDSGVARTSSSSGVGYGPLSFGSSSALYMAGSNVEALTVGASGISGATKLYSGLSSTVSALQYDNGQLYLSTGAVVNASTGALTGTFYSSPSVQAFGPVVSDSTVGRAFIASSSFSNNGTVYVFDENSFNQIGSIPVNGLGTQGYPTSFRKIVRWGQNGLAVAAIPSAFTSNNQIYIFQTPLVKDLSSSPADVSVSLTAPATATSGTAVSWVAKVSNSGPNAAVGATLSMTLDPSLIINSVIASQGTCNTGTMLACDLGGLANGATATVTVSATPTNSGTLAGTANVSSTSYDPGLSNNQSTTSTTVTGGLYGAVPTISAISPNLVQAGSASFTLKVTGTGFNAQSTVNLGTTALATSYVSSTQLTATVTAAEIANYGWAAVTVSNPTPGGGVSSLVPLTIYDLVNVPAHSILFDPYAQSLYATVPSTATSITGNSVVSINPFTGAVGTPVAVGSEPTVMAETADGNYLYIGLSGSDSLAQFNLLTQSVAATIPLTYSSQKTPALSLAAMPGTDTTLAIGISNGWNNFGIFDVNGNTGSFRPNVSGIYEGVNPVFASPTELYAYDSQTSGSEFYRYNINASGLTLIDGTTLNGMGGFSGGFQLANGLVYGGSGGIANPNTTPPSQIATLPLIDFYGSGDTGFGVAAAPDPSLQKDFLMLTNTAGTWAYGLTRYDLTTFLPEAVVGMPTSASGVSSNWTMLRFGQDGLALLSYDNFGITPAVSQLILLRGPFVAPQELGTNAAASLTTSSATTIAHNSGNTMLTLTGSNFLPGVAVTWNGSYRTTTIVDATHVTVAIPASDLVNAGTGTLVATNPGAAASNALQVTIN